MGEDTTDEKLRNKGQTEMKHRILRLYLQPWMTKVSQVDSELVYVDGFAGSGIYEDGTTGSPLIAMNVADKVLSQMDNVGNRVDRFKCVFVENDPDNYDKLQKNVAEHEKRVDGRIDPDCVPRKFQDWAAEFIQEYEEKRLPPSLIFIDPFGYSDIPFGLLSDFLDLRYQSIELLINLMAGKMARWMTDSDKEQTITDTMGTTKWREEIDETLEKNERAEAFCDLYERQWKTQAHAEFTMPFEMIEETKKQVCYYLVHVTNHLHGLKVMKETMYNAGANDQYAYLGPNHTGFEDDQLSFTKFGDTDEVEERIRSFASDLHSRYEGETIRFEELLRENLDQNVFRISDYRKAFEILSDDQDKLEVNGESYTIGNNVSCNIDGAELNFLENYLEKPTLNEYL